VPLDSQQLLGQGVYTPREAARLIGSSQRDVLRWTRGNKKNRPVITSYYRFLEDSTEISFSDLVELRIISAMRNVGISLQAIRFAIDFAEERLGIARPLLHEKFKVDGTELLLEAAESDADFISLSKKRPGQKVFKEIIKQSLSDIEYDRNIAARWRPKGFAQIIIDPQRHFGEPILDDFGISTFTLYREHDSSHGVGYLSKLYEIPAKAVRGAIQYESSLEQQ
jgi:uncharacterized protein (DUF433 family)